MSKNERYKQFRIVKLLGHHDKMARTKNNNKQNNKKHVEHLDETDILLFFLKDARSVSFRSELFTSYILTIFKQRNLLP